jgi:hypothetical protein
VCREGQGLAEQAVLRGVEREPNGVGVGQRAARRSQHLTDRRREDLFVVGLPVDQARDAAGEVAVELLAELPAGSRRRAQRRERRVLGRVLERDGILQDPVVERLVPEHFLDHAPDDLALLGRRVLRLTEPPVAKERDAGDRVVQVREGRDREHVAGDLLGALLDGGRESLRPVAPKTPREEPEVPLAGERRQKLGQPPVRLLLPPRRFLEDFPLRRPHRRHGVVARLDLDVALGDLFRVVEGMGVQERPEELTRHVLQRELEVGVLERRVVPRVVDRARERVAPLGSGGGLILRDDAARRVAGPGRRDDVLEGAVEGMHEPHLRSGGGEREARGGPGERGHLPIDYGAAARLGCGGNRRRRFPVDSMRAPRVRARL